MELFILRNLILQIGTYRKELERAINAHKGTCDKIEGQHHENEVDEEDEQSREAETKSLVFTYLYVPENITDYY